jgi:hypothetical protein
VLVRAIHQFIRLLSKILNYGRYIEDNARGPEADGVWIARLPRDRRLPPDRIDGRAKQRPSFRPVDEVKGCTMDDNIERTLQQPHESGIDASVESRSRDGMRVRIGNDKADCAQTRIDQTVTSGGHRWPSSNAVARWLHEMAVKCFPSS